MQLCSLSWGGELGPIIDKAAATAQIPVNEAVDAAVFDDFVGINKAINEAAASAQ